MTYKNRRTRKKPVAAILTAALLCAAFLPTAAAISYCDVNLDDKVTASDARMILRAAVGLQQFSEEQTAIADANRDGKVTASDARSALRTAVQLDAATEYLNADIIGRIFFNGGSGTAASPYLIATKEQFGAIYRYPAAHYKQTADIDFANQSIAGSFSETNPFTGSYDGNGKKLSRIITYNAIFGYVSENGVLEKIIMEECGSAFGALLATYNHGLIRNCRIGGVSDCTAEGTYSTGLLVNVNTGSITNCSVSGTVTGKVTGEKAQAQIGGVAGQNSGVLSGCIAQVDIAGQSENANPGAVLLGGIAAWNRIGGIITDCESAGTLGEGTYVGGVAGYNQGAIRDCVWSGSPEIQPVGNNAGTVE